jgi:serine/threonine protein kinase
MIGGYTLIGVLGHGGMGKVYLSAKASQSYAIKVLKSEAVANTDARARLTREVEILKRINHPNVVKFIDVNLDGATPWIAMEFVNGPNLKEWVEDRGVLESMTWDSTAQSLLSALQAIHSAGVTHRDIKPANVLMSSTGPLIIDFGIAYESDATSLTMTGVTAGSPGWMSPEQFDSGEVTSKSDVFSLASTLYYAATGISPWGDDSTSVSVSMRRILFENPDLSKASESQRVLLEKLLEKSPNDRPSSEEALRLVKSYSQVRAKASESSPAVGIKRRIKVDNSNQHDLQTSESLELAQVYEKEVSEQKAKIKPSREQRLLKKTKIAKIEGKKSTTKKSNTLAGAGSVDNSKTQILSYGKTEFIQTTEGFLVSKRRSATSRLMVSGALVMTFLALGAVAMADRLPNLLTGLVSTMADKKVVTPLSPELAGTPNNDPSLLASIAAESPSPDSSIETKGAIKPKSSPATEFETEESTSKVSEKVDAGKESTSTVAEKIEPGFVDVRIVQLGHCHHQGAAMDLQARDANGNWKVVYGGEAPVVGEQSGCGGNFPKTPRVDIVLQVGTIVRWRVYSTGGDWEYLGWAYQLGRGTYLNLPGGRLYENGVLVRTEGSNRGWD